MKGGPNIARIGSLIGDTTRATMLSVLMGGKALTASELARESDITAQTASTHLAKLLDGGLLVVRKQGRHKYFALASSEVAHLLESLMNLSACQNRKPVFTGPKDQAMRHARVCYKHLAGDRGVQLYESLISREFLLLEQGNLSISRKGSRFISDLGIDIETLAAAKAPLCRECLDWSERRSHLSGSLGRALLTRFTQQRWMTQDKDSRIIRFTPKGKGEFDRLFPRA